MGVIDYESFNRGGGGGAHSDNLTIFALSRTLQLYKLFTVHSVKIYIHYVFAVCYYLQALTVTFNVNVVYLHENIDR